MEAPRSTVSAAVREHLRRLCLREFPCGAGSWNKSRFLPQTCRTWKEPAPGEEEEAVSPGEETVEALLDLACSPQSPWALPEGSSAEDRFLRELAIRSPPVITDGFFFSYFRSLRVVDKEVDEVDRDLLRFRRLEELVLSANRIREIDAAHLPPTLKVLELYGNQMCSLQCLCARPPPLLQHLGLGHNKLLGPLESAFVTSNHWPNLVSLDLSFNDLTGLQSMVASLRSLPRLRLLLLQGNPLALVPYYRGFTIDSLARLCVLDDITVSPSEKHQFRRLSHIGEFLAQEAQLVVTIGNVVGLPDPSVSDPEPGPQGPFVTYSYYVTYDFVEDEGSKGTQYGSSVLAEVSACAPTPALLLSPSPLQIVKPLSSEQLGEDFLEEVDGSQGSAELSPASEPEELEEAGMLAALPKSTNSAEELAKLRPKIDPRLFPSPGTVLFSTAHRPWAEAVAFGYEMLHALADLRRLKAFLLAGTTVTVVEEKIVSWAAAPPSDSSLPGRRRAPDKEKRARDQKGRDEQDKKGGPARDRAGKEEKERKLVKKKKELPKDLRQDPPVLRVLGSSPVALEPLLAGEPLVAALCDFGVLHVPDTEKPPLLRDSKAKGKKAPKDKRRSWAPAPPAPPRPEPLTVEVQVQLGQSRSAEEALRAVPLLGPD
ncbi:leucine-rich repeat-containing protein 43 [Talpa occidentalis]|uniref:leucine-rich repeat-containing protein 43 n=1 Tax=Talpa occidentalis TaxID=50954 RepID=UPI00188FE8B8|nr:leucine-rich repeat-containing protein 43 [Talpa occidentalis]